MTVLSEPSTLRPVDAEPDEGLRARRSGTVGAVVVAHLGDLVERLRELDGPAREDQPDAVHQLRITTRRLRSWLATVRPAVDRSATDPVRDELKWLATILGQARDAEVQRARLVDATRALPGELVLGPVTDRIDTELRRRKAEAMDQVREALDSDRYRALLAAADQLVRDPPLTDRAERGRSELARMIERAAHRVDRAARTAGATELDPAAPDRAQLEALHDLRKAAKRARYAAEAVTGVLGRPAERLATRMEDLHDALGEHQDSVDARTTLRAIGVNAHLAGENGFTFGLLHGGQAAASRDALAAVPRLARRATDRPAKATLR
jgi:CHAD domain-containing protein